MTVFFTAHTGVALAAQAAAPRVPLPVLLLAANGLDLMCFGLAASAFAAPRDVVHRVCGAGAL